MSLGGFAVVWWVVLGLAAYLIFQTRQLAELTSQVRRLESKVSELLRFQASRSPEPQQMEEAPQSETPLRADGRPLATPATEPQPEASRVQERPPPVAWAEAAAAFENMDRPSVAPAAAPRIEPRTYKPLPSLSDWLSENGLAWIGGGALALGGLLLVAYAAQAGVFTPELRILSAGGLGLVTLALGEALRRGVWAKASPNLLVAALTTGAGSAILYAAIWAAYGLYGFIPGGVAALMLAGVSFGLLALALLHSEELGVLAIVAAYATPIFSGSDLSRNLGLDLFITLILATGLAVAAVRNWSRVGVGSLSLALLWAFLRGFSQDFDGMTLLTITAPAFSLLTALWRTRVGDRDGADRGTVLVARLPLTAIIVSSCFSLMLWPANSINSALTTITLVGLVSLGVRRKVLIAAALAAPTAVVVLAALMSNLGFRDDHTLICLCLSIVAVGLGGLIGGLTGERQKLSGVIGASGVALSLTLAARALIILAPGWDWIIDSAFAGLLAGGATLFALKAPEARQDLATAAWVAAAAEATGLAMHAGLDARIAPTAYGILACVLAAGAVRLKWRGMAESGAVAALASFGSLLSPEIAGAAFSGRETWIVIGGAATAATLTQVVSWRLLKRRGEVATSAEAVSTLAVMSGLLGAFLVLQCWSATRLAMGGSTDAFSIAALRTLLILAAALMLSIRGGVTAIGRARAPAFLALGALHGVGLQVIAWHPWWGEVRLVMGPPVFDTLALGLLAPAALIAEITRRLAARVRGLVTAAAATAFLFVVIWMISEIRRLFHGPILPLGDFGYAETAAYGVAFSGLAFAIAQLRRRFDIAPPLGEASHLLTWIAQAVTLVILAYSASPWWGPLTGGLQQPALLGLFYVLGCLLSFEAVRDARRSQRVHLALGSLIATGAELFALITLVVRYAFHGGAMRAPLAEASFETWTFSAVWAIYGLLALSIGAGRRDRALRGLGLAILLVTTAKVFLFDMARLEGIIRAGSFLALGAVLLAGAVAARRFAPRARETDP